MYTCIHRERSIKGCRSVDIVKGALGLAGENIIILYENITIISTIPLVRQDVSPPAAMRATTLYAAAWLATAATAVPATQFGDRHVEGRAEQSLDDFLDSVGVEPSAIPSSSRNLTSCRLACAILSAADEDALVTERSDPTRYEEESEDHWFVPVMASISRDAFAPLVN